MCRDCLLITLSVSSCCVGVEPGKHSEAFHRLFLPSVVDGLLSLAGQLMRRAEVRNSRPTQDVCFLSSCWYQTVCLPVCLSVCVSPQEGDGIGGLAAQSSASALLTGSVTSTAH